MRYCSGWPGDMMRKSVILVFMVFLLLLGCSSGKDSSAGAGDDSGLSEEGSDDFADEPTKRQGASGSGAGLLPLCLGVQDPMYMTMCSAAMNGDAKMCDQVRHDQPNDEEYFKDMCRIWVAAVNKDFEACKSIDTTIQGRQMLDCEMAVAEAMQDLSLCAKLSSENARNGCEYRVKVSSGKLALSECEEPECVHEYALVHRDAKACDKFADVTSALIDEQKFACNAMVAGDTSKCRQAPGGMFGWEMCMKKGGMGKAILGNGNFEPSACEDDNLCIRATLGAMVSYLASS